MRSNTGSHSRHGKTSSASCAAMRGLLCGKMTRLKCNKKRPMGGQARWTSGSTYLRKATPEARLRLLLKPRQAAPPLKSTVLGWTRQRPETSRTLVYIGYDQASAKIQFEDPAAMWSHQCPALLHPARPLSLATLVFSLLC
mmetsp:Transcript_27005/g.61015  ORF Transcript_27005/g.61015 Transcript_27005/m.61015 type:complete len:141 (+) Transcript_27005:65-487(+)